MNELRQAYSEFAFQLQPAALLTLTVREPNRQHGKWLVPDETLLRKTNELLHWVNADLYGRDYRVSGRGLRGFGCIEKQSNYQPHIHLAFSNREVEYKYKILKEVLFKKVKKINLFNSNGIDLRRVGADDEDLWRLGAYLAKGGRMLTLDYDGVF